MMLLVLGWACSGGEADPAVEGGGDDAVLVGTKVETADIARQAIHEIVSAPGRTAALREVHVRAPFGGVMASVSVVAGDLVRAGQVVAVLRSDESVAALAGAQALLAAAADDSARAEATRAVELAKRHDVSWSVTAPEAGVVLTLDASKGDRLSEGDDVLSLSPSGALYFRAQLAQGDVARVHAGQSATVTLSSSADPEPATVGGSMAATDGDALDVPLRVDFVQPLESAVIGLFGQVQISVDSHEDALVLPRAAVLTDDIEGTQQIATVDAKGLAHWVPVEVGLREGDLVEISGAGLAEGGRVIVSGQIGLPEGAPVRVEP